MRVALAVLLVRLATRIVSGRDDRVVLLNTQRVRNVPGKWNAGRVVPFMSHGPKTAIAFSPDKVVDGWGTPVPAIVARLAGWKVEPIE